MITTNYLGKRISAFRYGLAKKPTAHITFARYFDLIKSEFFKPDVMAYRDGIGDKAALSAVMPSGMFINKRNDGLIGFHTGIIVLDLDYKDNKNIDLDILKKRLSRDQNVFAIHRSVSGKGLAIYVAVFGSIVMDAYTEVRSLYERSYDIVLDKQTSNVARLRFISIDKDIYVNPSPYPLAVTIPTVKRLHSKGELSITEKAPREIHLILNTCLEEDIDLTKERIDWLRLGSYLTNFVDGRVLFHRFSEMYPDYEYGEADDMFNDLIERGYFASTIETVKALFKRCYSDKKSNKK